ncbi:MAG: endo-1,4-beta-xylanase [Clostridia bacterium]|nr:endo-1,4-beta-xylanase [Clostridia bacterium]
MENYNRRQVLEQFELQKDFMEDKINYGIEMYRKGYLNITVKDSEGNVIPGAKVKINQKTHEFKFGANIFMLDELETDEKNEKYKKHFAELFNMATLPFYWDALEPEEGHPRYAKDSEKIYRRPAPDLCVEYCEEHGIEPRLHCLSYDAFFPKWLYDADVHTIKKALEKRYKEISERYADKIPTIEVINEMEWRTWKTAFYTEPDFVEWSFKQAEKYFPANELTINEHAPLPWEDRCLPSDKYYAYIEANMLKGARIDAIGMQYHNFFKRELEYEKTRIRYNPELLYKHMDLYARFGKPLQVTEITVPAYSWEAEDEEIQAEILEKLYKIWFSHPNMEQIIYWNLVDGYAHLWDPSPEKIKASQGDMTLGENKWYGGLFRFDMTPKPAYFMLKNLIKNEWHTEAETVSGADGVARIKGFYGTYDVEITVDGKTVTKQIDLSAKKNNNKTVII